MKIKKVIGTTHASPFFYEILDNVIHDVRYNKKEKRKSYFFKSGIDRKLLSWESRNVSELSVQNLHFTRYVSISFVVHKE